MRITAWITTALLVMGCHVKDKDAEEGNTRTTVTTTGTGTTTGTVTGTASGTATGDTTDTTVTQADWVLSGEIVIPSDAITPTGDVSVALIRRSIADGGFEGIHKQKVLGPIAPGDVVPYAFGMPDVPDAADLEADPYNPGNSLLVLSLGAYVDENGDGLADPDDTFLGTRFDYIAYFEGEITGEPADYGLEPGWVDLSFDLFSEEIDSTQIEGDYPNYDMDATILPSVPSEALTVTITPDLDFTAGAGRVDIYNVNASLGVPAAAAPTVLSTPLPGGGPNQQIVMPDLPDDVPADHLPPELSAGEFPDAVFGTYAAIAYEDADADAEWDETSEIAYASSAIQFPGEERNLFYVKGTGWNAWYYPYLFGNMGWVLFDEGDFGSGQTVIPVPWSDGLILNSFD